MAISFNGKVAGDYLAIRPSEVDIERLFSGVHRWALDGDTISIGEVEGSKAKRKGRIVRCCILSG